MPPIRSSFILFVTAICVIEPNSGRVPYQGRRYQGEPQNVSGQPYAGYRAWRNGEPIDDRITDDEDVDEDLNNQEGPYLWVSEFQSETIRNLTFVCSVAFRTEKSIQIQSCNHRSAGTCIHPTFVIQMIFYQDEKNCHWKR